MLEAKKTALDTSAATDEEQPSASDLAVNSIAQTISEVNSDDDLRHYREMLRAMDPRYLHTMTMTDIYDVSYTQTQAVIAGLLWPCTYILAGAPKVGKSFLAAQLCYHVSTGTPVWGMPVRHGTVLYMALEDTYARIQHRLYGMYGAAPTSNLHICIAASQIGRGMEEQLDNFLVEHPDTVMVVIDTLGKARDTGGKDYSYAADYEVIGRIKSIADNKGICVVIVHHTRKQPSDDPYDMISGTNGLFGSADGALVMRKDHRLGSAAILDVCGRDQPDIRLHLSRDKTSLCWALDQIEKEPWLVPPEPILELIAQRINADCPTWTGTATECLEMLGITDLPPNTLTYKLNINAARLAADYNIRYLSCRNHAGRRVSFDYIVPPTEGKE